ncbi:Malic enzyme [Pseudomonas syringae pv. actinidiae]|uniref:Malic enzyme n=1 Tax=Pseudomonas syringae pv. actinidiae TaxID=103796 RepID=A0A2V0QGQ6_PSESF|nr:Malic enzyme [Pseudomonas syringae pv. actinidiae]
MPKNGLSKYRHIKAIGVAKRCLDVLFLSNCVSPEQEITGQMIFADRFIPVVPRHSQPCVESALKLIGY